MATKNEKDTTRARANMLRHAMTHPLGDNPFDNDELKETLDLCLSCKGCKKECPSTVDMAKLKAEFQQHYFDSNGIPLRSKIIAGYSSGQRVASFVPWLWNALVGTAFTRRILNSIVGFHPNRSIPRLAKHTLKKWIANRKPQAQAGTVGEVVFLCDEFTNYNDVEIGIAAIELLERLGYRIIVPELTESGRTWLSKGFLRKAKLVVNENTRRLADLVAEDRPIVGVEPSAILTLRDEAIDLASDALKRSAREIASRAFTIEEFLARENKAGRVMADQFTDQPKSIQLHGHCFQKALGGVDATLAALGIPANYTVTEIPSGCCGMAGSFGYEKEHYDVSMQIGELVLFPAVRAAPDSVTIAAPGTSCRHQIHDGTARNVLHPVEILLSALKQPS